MSRLDILKTYKQTKKTTMGSIRRPPSGHVGATRLRRLSVVSNCGCENQGQPGGAGVIEGCFSRVEKLRKRGQRCQDNNLVDFRFGIGDFRRDVDFNNHENLKYLYI